MENKWNLDDTYYNKEVVTCPVYSKLFRGKSGRVYVMDKIEESGYGFHYTCSFGANSEYSYSGCFNLNLDNSPKTIEDVFKVLDVKVNHELANTRHSTVKKFVLKETGFNI